MNSSKVKCTCGWSWNKSDSSKKDMHVCHNCGKSDVNMKNGGWLNDIPKAQEGTQTMNSRQKKGVDLQLQQLKKEQEDKKELHTTGTIKHPKSIAFKDKQKELAKKQTYVTQDDRSEAIKKYDETKGKSKEFKKTIKPVIQAADVTTDIMQLGNFVPHPIGQAIGELGNVAGAAIDTYEAADDFSEGNYGSAAINAGSAILPMFLEGSGYTRDMYNTNPGSLADDIASLGNRSGNYIPLTTLPHAVAPSTIKGINFNRALLGTLGAETYMDIPKQKNGGWLDSYADGGTMQEHQENYNDSKASASPDMIGDGFSNVGRNYSPAWGGQFEEGGEIPKAQNGLWKENKKAFVDSTLNANKHLDFVKRLYDQSKGSIQIPGQPGRSTHFMADDKNRIYPTVVNKKGKLTYLSNPDQAWEYANDTGEYIDFKTPEQAAWFANSPNHSTGYKMGTNVLTEIPRKQMGGNVYPVNYVPQAQGGMSLPGATGSMYARIGAPSKGPRRNQTDVTDASAQNGKEMQYYQNGLDWKPKTISRDGGWLSKYEEGGIIKDDRGQWDHPGEITEIGSNNITMEGVPYDVLGISDTGDTKLMKPGKNYKFKGKKVTEFPMAKNGLRQEQKGLVNLDQLTNFTNYNTKQPGGWLDNL